MATMIGAALAGCAMGGSELGSNSFAARDRTVEYVRVFDIKTSTPVSAVVRAASEGISRNVKDAKLATLLPETAEVQEQPGHFKLSEVPGTALGPSCDGASWTAKARPEVRGGKDLQVVACLYPYQSGYHLDMYAAFVKKEGGWLALPRRAVNAVMGTPEKFAEKIMLDVVRSVRETTQGQVALVEARPDVAGAPWMEPIGTAPRTGETAKP